MKNYKCDCPCCCSSSSCILRNFTLSSRRLKKAEAVSGVFSGVPKGDSGNLEAQQQYFSYRAILVAIVSQDSFVLVFGGGVLHNYRAIRYKMGSRTDVPV